MALVRSSLLSSISGSIGGTTYARSRGGMYARNRTVPINPKTASQDSVRSFLGDTAGIWSEMSLSETNAWKNWAQGYHVENRLGETYSPSGRQAFMQLSLNLRMAGLAPVIAIPARTDVPNFDITKLSFVAEQTGGALTLLTAIDNDNQLAPFDASYQIQFSPPQIAGRGDSYRNRMRGQGQWLSPLTASLNALTAYNSTFGGGTSIPTEKGQVIVIKIRAIDLANGLASSYFYTSVEIVDG